MSILSENNYFDVYVWDIALKIYQSLLMSKVVQDNISNEKFQDLEKINQIYNFVDLWSQYIFGIGDNEFKYNYYTKLYEPILRDTYKIMFDILSASTLQNYIKSNPKFLKNFIKLVSRNYDYIQDVGYKIRDEGKNYNLFLGFENQLEICWNIWFSEINFSEAPISDVLDYISIIPAEAFSFIDPKLIIDRVSIIAKVSELDIRVISNFGNNNLQKIAIAFARMWQSVSISDDLKQILQDLISKKVSILHKGKGKLRMSLDELKAFDIIINDILETNQEAEEDYIKEYLNLFELFLEHFSNLYQSYLVNEDVIGILKFIYLSDSKYFSKARDTKLKEMDKISMNILPKHLDILNSWIKTTVYEHNQNEEESEEVDEAEENDEVKKTDEVNKNDKLETKLELDQEFIAGQIDEEELLKLLNGIFKYLPQIDFHKNLLIDQIETRICKKFTKMTQKYIFKYVNLIYNKLGGVGFDVLSKLEEQFLKGNITDLSPRQIAQLMRVWDMHGNILYLMFNFIVSLYTNAVKILSFYFLN